MKRINMFNFQPFLETPVEVFWYLTKRCNLTCGFCLENSLPATSEESVSEETRQIILREIVKCQVLKVQISGGEPFLFPQLDNYVEFLAKEGISVTITSNGLLITENIASRIARAGARVIEISIYPEVQSQSFQAIKLLREAGLEVRPRAVLTRHLCENLRDFLQACADNNVNNLLMQEVGVVGRALDCPHKYTLTVEELEDASDVIASFHDGQDNLTVSFVSITLAKKDALPPVLCDVTSEIRKRCEIRPDGNVIPCSKTLI
jgi:MoaA/NifB/PqqE/SkfB family radical SAM enzyme